MFFKPKHIKIVIAVNVCFAMLVELGCDSNVGYQASKITSDDAVSYIDQHIDFYSNKLKIGMPKQTALSYLPRPQNTNTKNVCVWVQKSTESIATGRLDWQWLQATRSGYFLVFADDKLVIPLCANAAFNPHQALEFYAGMTTNQIQQILSPETTSQKIKLLHANQ